MKRMKRGNWIKGVAAAAAVVTVTGCVGAVLLEDLPVDKVSAAEKEEAAEEVLTEALGQQIVSHSAESGKEETVYVIAGADGATRNIIVSNQLKNGEGAQVLEDETTLTDIENVKGTQAYTTGSGDAITWQAGGSDIFYQGTTDAELPVGLTLTYYLDGVEIKPEELAGKSGHVVIRFDYENRAKQTAVIGGEETEIYVPFAVISGAILPLEHFSSITVSSGKILTEGNNAIVVGFAFPGLAENLSISDDVKDTLAENGADTEKVDVDSLDYVEIEADVVDFELEMTLSMVLPDLFSDIDLGADIDLSGVSDQLDTLKDSMTLLSDSSEQLVDGSEQLAAGARDLAAGAAGAKDGAYALAAGMQQLSDGGRAVAGGVGQLAETLNDMMIQLTPAHDGYAQFEQAVGQMMAGYGMSKEQAVASVMQAQGMTQNELTYLATLSGIYDGLAANAGDMMTLVQGANELSGGIDTVNQGAWTLYDGLTTLSDGANLLEDGSRTLYDGMRQFDEEGIQELAAAFSGVDNGNLVEFSERLNAVMDAGESYRTFSGAPEGVDSSVKFIIRTEAIRKD
ncbi:MAG: hypothetical protein K2N41_05885 [Lachnospiraceae bacterium]|nr:hypothetical protein [Lachnospiraceae bacterium]MDE7239228.1 hypothetical protein [Lachnospiraceae bacterium]